jgi:hypothetical protein
MDDVELDMRNMGVEERRTRALDRSQWAAVVREDKVQPKGL